MRVMSRKHLVLTVVLLGLAVPLAACSDKQEQEQQNTQAGYQAAPVTNNTAQFAPAPTRQAPAAAQKDTSDNAFVPAPLSRVAQSDPGRQRATYQVTSEYKCKNGTAFRAVFKRSPSAVDITFPGRVTVTLPRQELQGIGFWYASQQYSLRGSGAVAQWAMKGRDPVDCTVSTYEAP